MEYADNLIPVDVSRRPSEETNMADAHDDVRHAEELLRRDRWPQVRHELPRVCETIGEVCGQHYTYSLAAVANRLPNSPVRESLNQSLQDAGNFAMAVAGVFKLLDELNLDASAEQTGLLFNVVRTLVHQISWSSVRPFLDDVRRQGAAEASVIDGYGDFRRHWDALISRIEELSARVGSRLDLSSYVARELGVSLRS